MKGSLSAVFSSIFATKLPFLNSFKDRQYSPADFQTFDRFSHHNIYEKSQRVLLILTYVERLWYEHKKVGFLSKYCCACSSRRRVVLSELESRNSNSLAQCYNTASRITRGCKVRPK